MFSSHQARLIPDVTTDQTEIGLFGVIAPEKIIPINLACLRKSSYSLLAILSACYNWNSIYNTTTKC